MKNKEQMPSPEEMAEIEKQRMISDGELLNGGAEYKINKNGNRTIEPTKKQIKDITKEHEQEMAKKAEKELELAERNKIKAMGLPKGAKLFTLDSVNEIKDKDKVIKELEENYYITSSAKEMLANVDWEEELDNDYKIIAVTVEDLFKDKEKHTYKEIIEKAKEFGLKLIPGKLAPIIRGNYPTNGELTKIAMKAIPDSDNKSKLFNCYWYDSRPAFWAGQDSARDEIGFGDSNGTNSYSWKHDDRFFFAKK